MNKLISCISILFLIVSFSHLFAGGSQESAASSTRGRYLAGQGIIIPPEEIYPEAYIASIDYSYPLPDDDLGVYLYTGNSQVSSFGSEGILQIGIQGESVPYDLLPPMNLAFVIDNSSSMKDEDKIEWVKKAFGVFIDQVRNRDYVSLVEFNDDARVIFPSTKMDSKAKRESFLEAVLNLVPSGGSNLEKGLESGYEQVLANYRNDYINRVLFMSDGTEFSARLAREGAKSGDIRVSLLWNNRNDLDLHLVTPKEEEIYYGTPGDSTGGMLDVDMNVGGETSKPVENIFWGEGQATAGTYKVIVDHYSYWEELQDEYNYQVEVKNGDEYSHFEGSVPAGDGNYQKEVTSFIYKTDRSKREEKNVLYQLAGTYRDMGINISTIGVGIGFDVELMRNLAREGGGSSRFISDEEEMGKIFGTEFDRMVVPAAFDLEIEVELLSGCQFVDTWGYNHRVEGNHVFYSLPTLHLKDYETILLKYRTPLLENGVVHGDALPLIRFNLSYTNISGERVELEPRVVGLEISTALEPVNGISNGVVLQSGTMLNFAEGIIEIGSIFYSAMETQNEIEPGSEGEMAFYGKLLRARETCLNLLSELENSSMRLDDDEIFEDQLSILESYKGILEEAIGPSFLTPMEEPEPEGGGILGGNTEELMGRLDGLFREMSLVFDSSSIGTAALLGFTAGEEIDPSFLTFVDETARIAFAELESVRLVERETLDDIIAEQKLSMTGLMDTDAAIEVGELLSAQYIITGTIIPAGPRTIVFGRIIHVETGEIVSATQIFLESL
ncbi:MAG: VWA domain-containing protein [Spirochaetales bacterium]|nr:VWA domain-containing protein [Spirochaetales bacterium]